MDRRAGTGADTGAGTDADDGAFAGEVQIDAPGIKAETDTGRQPIVEPLTNGYRKGRRLLGHGSGSGPGAGNRHMPVYADDRSSTRRSRRVSPEQLAYFLAICEARGNRTVAARALGVSQPAVSHALRVLGETFHLPLLDERGEPTEAGVLLRLTAEAVLERLDNLERDMHDLREGQQSTLTIAASLTVGERRLPSLLRDFHQAHQDVALEVVVGNYDVTLAAFTRDQVDFGILGKRPPTREYFSYPIFPEDMVAFVASEPADARLRALLGMSQIEPVLLDAHTFVMRERESGSAEFALECLERAGCTPQVPVHLGSNEAVRRFVGAGIGIGLLPRSAVHEELHSDPPLLRELAIHPWHNVRVQWLVARRDRERTRAAQQFIDLLPVPSDVRDGDWRHDYPF